MGRYCARCGDWCSNSSYSRNQWMKGDGRSRCYDCVNPPQVFECQVCSRTFNTSNELAMHSQVHRPRNVACPVCGDQRFRSGANAVQHVESGYCRGCRGQDNARSSDEAFHDECSYDRVRGRLGGSEGSRLSLPLSRLQPQLSRPIAASSASGQ